VKQSQSAVQCAGVGVLVLLASLAAGCRRPPGEAVGPPLVWGGEGEAEGQFTRPRAVTCAPDGSVYVADFTGRIQRFDADGRFLRSWTIAPFTAGKPAGLGVAPNGDLLVGETHHHRIRRIAPDGQVRDQWGTYGHERGRFLLIRDVTTDPKGNVYVADYGYVEAVGLVSRIQKFSPDGTPVLCFGKQGSAPGELDRPEGVALDADGAIYVADGANHRVQVFSPEGEFLRTWGSRGEAPGQFVKPSDIDVSTDGYVYVADRDNHRVQVFTRDGDLVTVWGALGTGRRHLAAPWGLALGPDGTCFICDTGNHRIVRVRLRLPASAPPTPATRTTTSAAR